MNPISATRLSVPLPSHRLRQRLQPRRACFGITYLHLLRHHGQILLHENVDRRRWLSAALVCVGVLLLVK